MTILLARQREFFALKFKIEMFCSLLPEKYNSKSIHEGPRAVESSPESRQNNR